MVKEKRYVITYQMCMTRDVGTHGNLFGGSMMAWMDEAGAIFSRRYTGQNHVVTVRFSEFEFKNPVKVGQIIEFAACEPRLGRTSVTFDLVGSVDGAIVVRTNCTFVALDERGRPTEVKIASAFLNDENPK
jgi:acyl-CoA thioesterase YciA